MVPLPKEAMDTGDTSTINLEESKAIGAATTTDIVEKQQETASINSQQEGHAPIPMSKVRRIV
ncbi:hypothetical protein GGI08_009927, partial [Coemansia sp. S2]